MTRNKKSSTPLRAPSAMHGQSFGTIEVPMRPRSAAATFEHSTSANSNGKLSTNRSTIDSAGCGRSSSNGTFGDRTDSITSYPSKSSPQVPAAAGHANMGNLGLQKCLQDALEAEIDQYSCQMRSFPDAMANGLVTSSAASTKNEYSDASIYNFVPTPPLEYFTGSKGPEVMAKKSQYERGYVDGFCAGVNREHFKYLDGNDTTQVVPEMGQSIKAYRHLLNGAQRLYGKDACVFVGNLSHAFDNYALNTMVQLAFVEYGECWTCVFRRICGGIVMPYAVVQYKTPQDAAAAFYCGQHKLIGGREVRVEFSQQT